MTSSTITISGWTSLGAVAALIECRSTCGLWLIDAASQPNVSVVTGDMFLSGGDIQLFQPAATIWAIPGAGASSAVAGVSPQNIASGGGGGSNASVGSTGAAVPSSATAVGFQNAAGNLVLPTPSAGLPVADSGAAITGASIPAGGVGLTGWLSAIWSKLSGTLAVSAASLPLPTGAAADGTDNGGVSQPSGGTGIRGWLSAIYTKLMASVAVTGSVSLVDGPTITVSQSAQQQLFSVDTTNSGAVVFYVSSVGSSNSIIGEYSQDNTTWVGGNIINQGFAQSYAGVSGIGLYSSFQGFRYFRLRVSVYNSGTVTVSYQQRPQISGVPVQAMQGGPSINGLGWWTRIGDGTNGPVAVRPASTAPAATDPALVVAISPNSAGVAASAVASVNVAGLTTILSTATAGYQRLVATITTSLVGSTLSFLASSDNVNWAPVGGIRLDVGTVPADYANAGGSGLSAGITYSVACDQPYIKVIGAGTWTSGVVQWQLVNTPSQHIIVDQGAPIGLPWATLSKPTNSGGFSASPPIIPSAAALAATQVKASLGQVYGVDLFNNSAVWVYFHIYSGPVTFGTTPSAVFAVGPGGNRFISAADIGIAIATSIYVAFTGGPASTDNTVLPSGTYANNVGATVLYA